MPIYHHTKENLVWLIITMELSIFEPVIIICKDAKHPRDTKEHTFSTRANRATTGKNMPLRENKHSDAEDRGENSH